ncbi:MAG: UxaA family hydrolase [Pseudomonadota bacterium]
MNRVSPRSAILLHPDDNVICLLRDHQTGEIPLIEEAEVPVLREDVPLGHKIALRDIGQGDLVFKYGHAIGAATQHIIAGQHVHLHNLAELPQDKPG